MQTIRVLRNLLAILGGLYAFGWIASKLDDDE